MTDYTHFMQQALGLALTNLGQTWPNPAVGAVIVKDGTIIGEGCTARGGRPHAETVAIDKAGANANGATMYVSLEPCAHHGKTPPCTDAIINAGIARVVTACRDPHTEVNGKGITQLKAAGIDVIEGVCEKEARALNVGFFSVVEKKRPYVALKIASSADNMIASKPGVRTTITGDAAQDYVHRLRSKYDAILTGIGTVLADDPQLTVRIKGLEDKSPVRVILDRKHRLPEHSRIMQSSQNVPTWVLDLPELTDVMNHLAQKGITRVLVEAGQALNTAFLTARLVDRIYWLKSPKNIGNQGLAVSALDEREMLASFTHLEHSALPPDSLDIWNHV